MLQLIEALAAGLNRMVWGAPALLLLLGTGGFLTWGTRAVQLRKLPRSIRAVFRNFSPHAREKGGISPFQAVCTALAATVGTGNIAGVAGAIALGGPGAVFWMWISALLGMATKYAEVVLAVRFRRRTAQGYVGGPMYVIREGLGPRWAWLARCYCLFGVFAAFGVGNTTQVNTMALSIREACGAFGLDWSPGFAVLLGAGTGALVLAVLGGGAKRIGAVAEFFVPFLSASYALLSLGVLIGRLDRLPWAFGLIFRGAFSPRACTGGLIGSCLLPLRVGTSKGVFTNEAGMGTASIAHAGAETPHPAEQGLFGVFEVFADTLVICTMTALVILCSGVPIAYGQDAGVALTAQAFAGTYGPWVGVLLAFAVACFAFATVLGWGLYGVRCAGYLWGRRGERLFIGAHGLACIWGAVASPGLVWQLAEAMNGLMALPNLLAIWALSPEVFRLTEQWFRQSRKRKRFAGGADGGEHESIHQCQSLRAVAHAEIPSPGGPGRGGGREDLSSEHWPAGH